MIYLLDTNTVSALMVGHTTVSERFKYHDAQGDILGLCIPVYYELQRGLLKNQSFKRLERLKLDIVSLMVVYQTFNDDWIQAAHFWAEMRQRGRQLSDVDLLLAAMTYRLQAILVSNDQDFVGLPIQQEDWR